MGCSSAPAGDVQPRAVGKVAQAVWSNGDFENDAIGLTPPSGWSVTNYTNPSGVSGSSSSVPSSFTALNLTAGGKTETYVVGGTAESQIDPDLGAGQPFRFPKYGSRGVRVNYKDATDTGKNRNANALRQTMTVSASDTDPFDGLLHVRFVIAPVLENPSHGYTQQPYYFVELKNLTTNTALYQDFNTAGQSGVPWKTTSSVLTGNTLQWTDWQLVDVVPESGLSIGDSVQLTIIGSGCSLSGHFGRVYVDGMGSTVPGLYTWANGPSSVAPNGDIQYTVYYYNGAATTANGAHFDMQTPPQTTYRSVSGLSNCTGPAQGSTGTLVCPIGNVAPGGSGLFTVTVRANGSASGTITNGNYSIAAINSSPLLGSKVRTSVLGSGTSTADVHVTVTAANAVDWAGTMTYTIVVRNAGANSLSSSQINIVDAFPSQLTNVTWTCTENSTFWAACNGASGSGAINAHPTLSYFFGIGGQVTYTVTGTVISGSGLGSISNTVTATVSGGRTDPNTDDNKVTTVTGIGTPRTLTFTKTGSSSSGSVTSIPSGLSCGTGCSGSSPIFADNTVLTLTASPIPGATFTGWGGACSGTASTCSVTMDAAKSVSAGFAAPPVAGAAANVAVVSGSGQLARTGNAFGSSLVAYVTDAAGTPVNGATVTFTVPATGASAALSSTTATSNSSGLATITTATANATAGSYNVVATVPSGTTSASFALTNVGAPASITYVSGGTVSDPNQAPINTAFNAPLMVLLKDVNGNAVPGATVTYTVPASGASATLSTASATSDSSGYASVTATANGTVGAYTVSAATAGVASTVGFSLSNIANAPASVFVVSGNNQSIAPSNAFDDPLVVGVADSVGNPLKNVTVTFAAPGSGARATLAGSPATTNALGQAQVTATANATVGTYSVTASVAGVSTPATFTLTNTGSNYINVYSGSDQAVSIGSAFTSLVARVTNGSGAAVSGVVVTFAAPSSGASATLATPVTATTDASGLATKALTANTVAGSYVVTATTPTAGLPASFSLTNEAGAATSLTLTSGSSQHTRVTTDFPLALTATLKDASNNPVSGGTVTFTPPASGATAVVTGSPTTTDSNGQAIVTVVAGATAGGPYNVTATSGALSAIQFALTNDECAADSDCTTAQFCNTATYTCATKLSNGTAIPTIANHSPALAGTCSVAVGSAVCAAGVCSTTDDKCGLPNGEGACTSGTAATVCRSSACSVSNVCMASGGCVVVGDCSLSHATAGCVSGACTIASCSAGYGNCNGTVSDGCEVQTAGSDVTNCGGCGTVCSYAHAGATCTAGSCGMGSCSAGYGNCDGNAANGCETQTNASDVNNCGGCGTVCSYAHAGATCTAGSCGMGSCSAGYADCNSSAADGCEKQINGSDVTNCGGCGTVCSFAHAGAACSAGTCAMGSCSPGYADCDGNPANGCEVQTAGSDVSNCGGCGTTCSYAHAGATCTAGSCGMGSCSAGYADCNTSAADGCEKQINGSDVSNCGACGNTCSFAHAGATCSAGTCAMGSCSAGYADCDGNPANGCEVQINASDVGNCGACGNTCSYAHAGASCSAGTCAMGSCSAGYADCDASAADGCEVQTAGSDVGNCGSCGNACSYAHAGASCSSGTCVMGSCGAGYEDCNGSASDGCEIQTAGSDVGNCGSCGNTCSYAHAGASCAAGGCVMGSCAAGYEDCNGSAVDGCEVQTAGTDVGNCGSCGNACSYANAGASCAAGSCVMGSCAAGYEDCDASASNGCEVQTAGSDVSNCGACGNTCSYAHAGATCSAGTCAMGSCAPGYADCNGLASDGCEVQTDTDASHCGVCGNVCSYANAGAACSGGFCGMTTCSTGYADCNSSSSDGCEVQTAGTDASNCGACGNVCSYAHAGASCAAGTCAMGSCSAGYADCNGSAADGCEVQTAGTDAGNCGACGNACSYAHAGASCSAGSCSMGSCKPGYADCNGSAADGCEVQIDASDLSNCGACGNTCSYANAGASCNSGTCAMGSCSAGYEDCNGNAADGCEIRTNGSDVGNCGACGNACSYAHAGASCTVGTCAMGSCSAGYEDCNGSAADGCEVQTAGSDVNNCGSCGDTCSYAHAGASCAGGTCAMGSCSPDYADCNGLASDGCEVQTDTDVSDCGVCGNVCSYANAGAACSGGFCAMTTCSTGYADCDSSSSNGCEVQTAGSDVGNCGACGNTCSYAHAGATCSAGSCGIGSCDPGYANCNGSAADGCEVQIDATDVNNCGACGSVCSYAHAGASCSSGTCARGSCDAGYDDCNGSAADGCEAPLATDAGNCGACGSVCSYAHAAASCSGGSCSMGSCAPGYEDCNGSATDGCEAPLDTDVANCGTCGSACSYAHAAATCASGKCGMGTCAAGYEDCNGNAADGCEAQMATDTVNCGSCGTVCAYANAAASCSSGTCAMAACSPGYEDCNASETDGCEVQTAGSDVSNCGGCGTICAYAHAGAMCIGGACALAACDLGFEDCNANAADGCETQTIGADVANCGGCGTACSPAHASGLCVAGSCGIGSCNAGYADCDGNAANGCEAQIDGADVNNCGGCGSVCSPANASGTCTSGSCGIGACHAGYADCDGSATNGCEVLTAGSDLDNCGGCGTRCAPAHAGGVCTTGSCGVASCDAGYGDCDSNAANGCEVQTGGSDLDNCGGCGTLCAPAHASGACTTGSCGIGSCDPGYADCDGNAANGCELQIGGSDVNNCGGCGTVCAFAHAGATCTAGVCGMTTCSSGFANCDAQSADGCEVDTNSDVGHCGSCGTACSFAHAAASCNAGSCAMGACAANHADCNGSASDGCEIDTTSDANHCGGCGTVCSFAHAAASCTASSCTLAGCAAGYANCDSNPANGCEMLTDTSHDNCGACGNACSAAQYCATGTCTARKPNGDGCADAGECASGVCNADMLCGDPNGHDCSEDATCRGGACSKSGLCMDSGQCLVDDDCASSKFCDTSLSECTDKLPNGAPVPAISGHTPDLAGACTADVGEVVCSSSVCDVRDHECGYDNGGGSCDGSNAASVCRSGVCGADSECGYPDGEGPCTVGDQTLVCRSGLCNPSTSLCTSTPGCVLDTDCTPAQFCDTSTGSCTQKLNNGIMVPAISGHTPALTGACTTDVGRAVCAESVCDSNDDKCGFDNGDGLCDDSTSSPQCRSAVCGSDDKCGYPDGEGPCTSVDASTVCRSGVCSAVSHVCVAPSGCAIDADCSSSQFCDSSKLLCTAKLKNGVILPKIAKHTPALTGMCSKSVAVSVCKSAVCDATDDKCGYRNGEGSCSKANAGLVCRSGVCGGDGKCGLRDGESTCNSTNAGSVCRSGDCSKAHVCVAPSGCAVDADCTSAQFCDNGSGECRAKLDDGVALPVVDGHTPALSGMCSSSAGKIVCKSGVCDADDDKCGFANDAGSCTQATAGDVCRSRACGSDGKCGFPDGEGSCTVTTASNLCRSGVCMNDVCGPAPGCTSDKSCDASEYCSSKASCAPKKRDGKPCGADNQCTSNSCNAETHVCNSCIDGTCGKLKLSGGGCSTSGTPGTSGELPGSLLVLLAATLILRGRRRRAASV